MDVAPSGSISQAFPVTNRSASTRRWWLLSMMIALASAAVSLTSLGSLPLESHEVYVARTVEEMNAQGSWMIPIFNNEPRLRKSPLQYWLVMGVDALLDDGPYVSELAARTPSATAAVVLVMLTMLLGHYLIGEVVGLLAGLLLVASGGMLSYSHSARPEMVYAALCHAGLLFFALAWRTAEQPCDQQGKGRCSAYWALAGWAMLGLAAMAKGPQLPIMIAAGWAIGLVCVGRRTLIRAAMRPVLGIAIFIVLSGWWYFAIWKVLPNAAEIWRAETIDRYVGDYTGESWVSALNPYYLYRTAGLFMPWVVLYGLGLAAPWLIERSDQKSSVRLLWIVVVVAMATLSLSIGRRWYYMLPVMGPMAVLIAISSLAVVRSLWPTRWRWLVVGIVSAHVLALSGYEFLMHSLDDPAATPLNWIGVAGVTVLAMIVCGWLICAAMNRCRMSTPVVLSAMFLVGAVFMIDMGLDAEAWRDKRDERRTFLTAVQETIRPTDHLVGWGDDWPVAQYYLHRCIPTADDADDLASLAIPSNKFWLLVDRERSPTPDLGAGIRSQVVVSRPYEDQLDRLQLWRVERLDRAPQ